MNLTAQGGSFLTNSMLAALLLCLLLAAGCASRSALVIARNDPQYQVANSSKITIADHASPREEERVLREVLLAELRLRGFELVEPQHANFTLVYWIDEAWKPGTRVVGHREGTWPDPNLEAAHPMLPMTLPYFAPAGVAVYDQPTGMQRVVDAPFATKGIRLKVFPQESMRSGRLFTAWDGYIEMGSYIHEAREPVLLRTLLSYFGTEFTGRAKLVE